MPLLSNQEPQCQQSFSVCEPDHVVALAPVYDDGRPARSPSTSRSRLGRSGHLLVPAPYEHRDGMNMSGQRLTPVFSAATRQAPEAEGGGMATYVDCRFRF